ncbi:hypothetical protein GF361_03165 [Candidatus Woesearchaeota archaeon]|nr:hypothetical protein [Candidatus Woesearchaeota archaeon]
MNGILKSDDESMEVHLFDEEGIVEIEFQKYKNVAIEVKALDPTSSYGAPKGAIYEIKAYVPEENSKNHPFEYDMMFVMSDGTMIHRKDNK